MIDRRRANSFARCRARTVLGYAQRAWARSVLVMERFTNVRPVRPADLVTSWRGAPSGDSIP